MPVLRLKLIKTECTLMHLNIRSEKIGPKEYQPAADLKLKATLPGDILNSFSTSLMDQFFKTDLASPVPRDSGVVYPVGYDAEMHECETVIDTGVENSMKLQDTKVNTFRFTPLKGGFVELTFRVQGRPTGKDIGTLYDCQMKTITVSITPPDVRDVKAEKKNTRSAPAKETGTGATAPLH